MLPDATAEERWWAHVDVFACVGVDKAGIGLMPQAMAERIWNSLWRWPTGDLPPRTRRSITCFRGGALSRGANPQSLTSCHFFYILEDMNITSDLGMSSRDRALNQNELIVMLAILRRHGDAMVRVHPRRDRRKRTSRKMTFGVLYTVLARLEQDGLLTSRDGEATPERGGRAKKYFSITGKGQQALNLTLSDLRALQPQGLSGAAHA